jgi:tetratricopeptide (TPR) repeat protein
VAGTDDLPARQQTLRATIAWSHDLLTLDHQKLTARSTVFQGGWTIDAWESVCAATPEGVSTLVDAGLVRRRDGRFGMLDTIHEFAAERFSELPPGEQDALRDRHADWYGTWAADPDFGPPHRNVEDVERLRVVDAERANLSVACDRLATRDDRSLLRAVVFRLWLYWLTNGFIREGERWTTASLQGSMGPNPEDAAWITAVLGEFPRFSGDLPRALQLKQRAIALARVAGDVKGEAATHADIASVYGLLGNHARAVASAQRALDLRREIGSPGGISHALQALAEAHLRAGNLQAAQEANAGALAINVDDRELRVFAVTMATEIYRRTGHLGSAARGATEALEIAEGPNDLLAASATLRAAGAVLVDLGDHRRAALVLAVADRIDTEAGLVPWLPDVRADAEARIEAAIGALEREAIRAEAQTMSHREVSERAIEALNRHTQP